MQVEGWIGIYRYNDEIRVQPTLYKTKEEAVDALKQNDHWPCHLKNICEPIYVQLPTTSDK